MQSKDEKINNALKFLKDAKDYVHRAEQILGEVGKTGSNERKKNPEENEANQDISQTEEKVEEFKSEVVEEKETEKEEKTETEGEIVPGLEDFSDKGGVKTEESIESNDEEEVTYKPVVPDHDLANDVLDRPSNTVQKGIEQPEQIDESKGVKELDI